MYENRFARYSPHPMYDYGEEPETVTTHVTKHHDPVVVLRRRQGKTRRPLASLVVLSGAGAVAGKMLLGGPLAVVGGALLGALVEEAWSRLRD
jgi:hypothetical protein